MKRTVLTFVSAVALLAAGTAFAQNSMSDENAGMVEALGIEVPDIRKSPEHQTQGP